MHRILILLLIFSATQLVAADKATSLSDARDAVEANMRTGDGKKFDEQFGADFVQKHLGPFRDCKATAGGDVKDFWLLMRLDKQGTAREVLSYPTTKLASCASGKLLDDKFLPPPRPDYWVSVFMKFSR
jgi:hypothetical protein